MIGLLEIERLKEKSRQRLGDRFRLAEFHDQILGFGALPLTVLDEQGQRLDRLEDSSIAMLQWR